jgi:OmpA-OmpF porin, OOP family
VPGATPMVLEGVSFESGSARLQIGSYIELDSIARVLQANPSLRVEIGGHTDNAGTPADNQHLSTLRAEAVRNYLVAKGVPFQQMVARGYGSTVPRTPDTTPRGRALNRRVEIKPLPPP